LLIRRKRGPAPEPMRKVSALEFYQAALMTDFSGWWVYALVDRNTGLIFRVGQSESLFRRIDHYRTTYADRFDPAQVWLIRVADENEADLVELQLITSYQPECNAAGRADDLRRRAHSRVRGGRMPKVDPRQAIN
jgi:excinuclease UvrABC nuclease subunit